MELKEEKSRQSLEGGVSGRGTTIKVLLLS